MFPIPELTDAMLAEVQLDGFVDEWSDLIGEPVMTMLDFGVDLGVGSSRPTRSVGYRLPGLAGLERFRRLASMCALARSRMTITRIPTPSM